MLRRYKHLKLSLCDFEVFGFLGDEIIHPLSGRQSFSSIERFENTEA